jgi:hypothetical protein
LSRSTTAEVWENKNDGIEVQATPLQFVDFILVCILSFAKTNVERFERQFSGQVDIVNVFLS